MEPPELSQLRGLALILAIVIITLVLAGVKLETPVQVTPLGITLTIERPDLLTIGLVIAAAYTTLRYIYYGMLVRASPMRARRELSTRSEQSLTGGLETQDAFQRNVQEHFDRYYPRIGKAKATFDTVFDANGSHVTSVRVPLVVHIACLIEDFDFLLPVLANVVAVGLWLALQACS